jgi:hypothetical protein
MIQLIILLVLLIPILAIVLDSQVGRALAARLEGGRAISGPDAATHERIAFLEGEVERLGSELSRLEEESEFMHKLLTERSSGDGPTSALTEGEDHEPR